MGYTSEDQGALAGAFQETLQRDGLPAALRFLNGRTRHRFTGLYRFDGPWLRNVCLVDRENPQLVLGGDTPMNETYCGVVRETGRSFATDNACSDPRLVLHPARAELLAYCGVPVRGAGGECIGTLCHFDPRPRLAPVHELSLLEHAAHVLSPYVVGRLAATVARPPVSSSRRAERDSSGAERERPRPDA